MKQDLAAVCAIGVMLLAVGGCDSGGAGGSTEERAADTAALEPVRNNTTGESGAGDCESSGALEFICGPENAEDLLQIGDSQWLITSGLNGSQWGTDTPGHLYLINHETRDWEVLFPGDEPDFAQDMTLFPDCPAPLNPENFSGHGLALKGQSADEYLLYITSHGDREAVEAFRLDTSGAKPVITWIGCVVLPDTTWPNSVAILDDGGFVVTRFMDPTDPDAFSRVRAGEINGEVYEWHPGGEVQAIPGTELSGPNGILVSADNRWMYVAAFGTNQVVRFDRSTNPPAKQVIDLDMTPDNLRWSPDGTIYTAGHDHLPEGDCPQQPCGDGWSVFEIDPETMTARRITGVGGDAVLQGASTALPVGDAIWIGTYAGERIGILPKP